MHQHDYRDNVLIQSSERNFLHYRGFSGLHSQLLADPQFDIEVLEKELDELDHWDDRSPHPKESNTREEFGRKPWTRTRETSGVGRRVLEMIESELEAALVVRCDASIKDAVRQQPDPCHEAGTRGVPLISESRYGWQRLSAYLGKECWPLRSLDQSKSTYSAVDDEKDSQVPKSRRPVERQHWTWRDEERTIHGEIDMRSVRVSWPSYPGFRFQLAKPFLFSTFVGRVAAEEILGLDRNIVSDTLSYIGDLIGPAAVIATFIFGVAILFTIAFCISAKKGSPRKIAFVAGVASVSWWLMELVHKGDESQKTVAGWVSAVLWGILLALCAKGLDDSDQFMLETLCFGGLMVMGIIFLLVAVKVLEGKLLDHNAFRTILSFGLPPLNAWTWFQFKRHLSRENPNYPVMNCHGGRENVYATSSAVEAQKVHSRSHHPSLGVCPKAPLAIEEASQHNKQAC